jgi:hypothetical protein
MYWLLLIGFLVGNLVYSLALLKRGGFDRVIGACFLAAALLTAFILSREFGGPGLPASINPWIYPAIQPLARILIGAWLWRARDA